MTLTVAFLYWLMGSASLCAGGFILHWLWQRHLHPLGQALYGWPQPAINDTIPLSVWPWVFIGLAIVGGMFFVGHMAGF